MTTPIPTTARAEPDFPQQRTLTFVSLAEGTSYVVLLALSAWHRGFDGPDLAPITGPIHGCLFLAYVALVLASRREAGWSPVRTLVLLAASIVPFGCLLAARHLDAEPDRTPVAATAG